MGLMEARGERNAEVTEGAAAAPGTAAVDAEGLGIRDDAVAAAREVLILGP